MPSRGWLRSSIEYIPIPGQDIETASQQAFLLLDSGLMDPAGPRRMFLVYGGIPLVIENGKTTDELVAEYHRVKGPIP